MIVWRVLSRLWRSQVDPALVIPPPVAKYGPLRPSEADAMRARAEARRARAEDKHAEGHAIETGEVPEGRQIKLVSWK